MIFWMRPLNTRWYIRGLRLRVRRGDSFGNRDLMKWAHNQTPLTVYVLTVPVDNPIKWAKATSVSPIRTTMFVRRNKVSPVTFRCLGAYVRFRPGVLLMPCG